jgi:acyl carrier protein
MDSLEQQVKDLVRELGDLPPDFDGAANLYLDLGVPSVKAMQLLMDLEDRFGVQIPDDQFVEAISLDKLTSLMRSLVEAKLA